MSTYAAQAYGMTGGMALKGRSLEGRAFARAAQLLNEAREDPENRLKAVKALRYNHQLWTVLQASMLENNGQMDETLNSDLLSLSVFVDRRTAEALADSDPTLLDALISINRNIAQGQLAN